MVQIWYVASERFGPHRPEWSEYIHWSGLIQLREVVGLDEALCPSIVKELSNEDWLFNVHEEYFSDYFTDLNYLLQRQERGTFAQILAVMKEPETDPRKLFLDARFDFCGFELIEDATRTSALTNCGGFPESFNNSELSEQGLLQDFTRAKVVRRALRDHNPDERHANCSLWGVWRMRE